MLGGYQILLRNYKDVSSESQKALGQLQYKVIIIQGQQQLGRGVVGWALLTYINNPGVANGAKSELGSRWFLCSMVVDVVEKKFPCRRANYYAKPAGEGLY